MQQRQWRRIWSGMAMLLLSATVLAASPVPERRVLLERNVDFPGNDIRTLATSSLAGCQTACLADNDCAAFTFNTSAQACFLKRVSDTRQPYEGAISGRVLPLTEQAQARALERREALPELTEADFELARAEALQIGLRHARQAWGLDLLRTAADERTAEGNVDGALALAGAAVAESDAAADWIRYSQLSQAAADEANDWQDRRDLGQRALASAINAWLRAEAPDEPVNALWQLADILEAAERGRDAIAPLRLAESLRPGREGRERLDRMVAQYGFRVIEHNVQADLAVPRICVVFSEALVEQGIDYGDYVALDDDRLVVSAEDQQLCIEGVQHGRRYTFTLRDGLPAASGEALPQSVDLAQYVRDRTPSVSFAGNAYVLPAAPNPTVPVQTVNLDTVDLTLYQLVDRNLLRAAQEGLLLDARLQAWQLDQLASDVAEVLWRGHADVTFDLNTEVTTRLPLTDALAGAEPGIYALHAAEPGMESWLQAGAVQWFVVSNLGVATLQGRDGLHVLVRHLDDASVAAGAQVQLLNRANRVLATGEVNDDGVARFDAGLLRGAGAAAPAMVVVREGEHDLTFLSLTDPAWDLSDRGVAGREPSGPVDVFLAADRGVYRPGDTLNATVLVRNEQGQALPDLPLTLTLRRPDGVAWWREVRHQGHAGGHVVNIALDHNVPRGVWRLEAQLDPDAEPLASQTVWVEDFLPERIDVTLTLPEGPMAATSDAPVLDVQATTLFGVPADGLAIEGDILLRPLAALPEWPGYHFGPADDDGRSRRESLTAAVTTNAAGRARIPVALPAPLQPPQPALAEVIVRVTEGSGRPVERQIERVVGPAGPVIGVRPDFQGAVADGGRAGFELMALDDHLQSTILDAQWTLQRLDTRYQWYQLNGEWRWEPVTRRDTVATGSVTLGEEPVSVGHTVSWGRYELRVEHPGSPYTATTLPFQVGGAVQASAVTTPDSLSLSLDRERYRPGDTAWLQWQAPTSGQAVILVMTDRLVAMETVPVNAGENRVPIAVTEDWGSGAYVSAIVLRPLNDDASLEPVRAVGLAHADIDAAERRLQVELLAPDEARPGEAMMVTVQVEALAADGSALPQGDGLDVDSTWLTLAAVDAGILNLTGYRAPDPVEHYLGQRRLGVELRDLYGRLIHDGDGATGQIRSGGGAGGERAGPPPSDEPAALFVGPLPLGPDGTLNLALPMPVFDGTLRLMAVVWNEQAVGAAERDAWVRDPVVVQTALPRFLAPGDRSQWHLDFNHVDGPAGRMALEFEVQGLALGADGPDDVTVGPGERATVDLPIQAGAVGDAKLQVTLTTPDGTRISRTSTLAVRSHDPVVASTETLTLAAGQSIELGVDRLAGYLPASASLRIIEGSGGPFDVPGLVAQLLAYPYACTEQLVSRMTPFLKYPQLTDEWLTQLPEVTATREATLAQILSRQAANGAFGLWDASAGNPWLDAYATEFLLQARQAGWQVPNAVLNNALDNLRNQLAYAGDFEEGGEALAYALWVLAQAGQVNIGDLRYYADEKADAFSSALALAQLGAALATMGERERSESMFELALTKLPLERDTDSAAPAGWRADFGTVWRDAAGVLALARQVGSAVVDPEPLARWLGSNEGELSPQEASWGLLAADPPAATTSTALEVDGEPVSGPLLWQARDVEAWPVVLRNVSEQPLTLQVVQSGVPRQAPAAGGNGYTLQRERFTLAGDPHTGSVQAGERYVVVNTIQPLHDRGGRLILDDALPAGFEIENPHLLQAGDIAQFPGFEPAETEFVEFRAERFLAAVDARSSEPLQLAYVVRAVAPGHYHYPAARVEDMYQPRFSAWTDTGRLTVEP